MSLCQHCISGVLHEGTPEGKFEIIDGVNTYVALPPAGVDYPKEKAVLILTDVFGIQLINNQLLADAFARNGFQVYVPDYFEGDPIPENALNNPNFDREGWRAKHGPSAIRPIIDKTTAALKARGITIYGATGYCFGARYTVDLALENLISVAVLSHPSMLKVPEDFHGLLEKSSASLLINSCEVDPQFPQESQKIADKLLGDGKYKPGFLRTYWPGCKHGFAVRGDVSDPLVKAGKEGSFKASVEFLLKL